MISYYFVSSLRNQINQHTRSRFAVSHCSFISTMWIHVVEDGYSQSCHSQPPIFRLAGAVRGRTVKMTAASDTSRQFS